MCIHVKLQGLCRAVHPQNTIFVEGHKRALLLFLFRLQRRERKITFTHTVIILADALTCEGITGHPLRPTKTSGSIFSRNVDYMVNKKKKERKQGEALLLLSV